MKKESFEFFGSQAFDVAATFGELLEDFECVAGDGTFIYASEETTLRGSVVMTVVIVSTNKDARLRIDIMVGGGAVIDLGAEADRLRKLSDRIRLRFKQQRIQPFSPGEDYYNT